jgi:exosortase
MTKTQKAWLSAALIGVGFATLYWQVFARLVHDWYYDDNYSHGFLIIPLALYLAWERRGKLLEVTPAPSALGLLVVVGSIGVLLAGILGSELFLQRVSMVGVVIGLLLFLLGWAHLGALAFPVALLLLMIPIPAIIFNQIAFPLQLLASRFGETAMGIADVPVLREGNVLILANTTLEVAEACSGIRSLVSLLTLAVVLGYFSDRRAWVRVLIVASSIPVAVITNGFRVAGTGIAAHRFGTEAAEGFFHEFSGWIVFAAAFAIMLGIQQMIGRFLPDGASEPVAAAV